MVKAREDLPLTAERLKEVASYDEATGHFWPGAGRFGVRRNRPMGHVEPNGYRRLMIDGVRYLAHRLAWLYAHGKWPEHELDHRNGKRDDNRLSNLRAATHAQNQANMKAWCRAGLKGAHYNGERDCWQSHILVNGKHIRLGRFDTPEAAHEAYMKAARRYRGDFAYEPPA